MKWIARPLVFALCTYLGVFAVTDTSTHGLRIAHANVPDPTEQMEAARLKGEPQLAAAPEGIRVMYAGFGSDLGDGTPYLRFIVHNGGDVPVTYRAYPSANVAAAPKIVVNGSVVSPEWSCINGSDLFSIAPGRSAEIRVLPHEFPRRPRRSDSIMVGLHLDRPHAYDPAAHYSEPFRLPLAFINSIDEYRYMTDVD